MNTKALTGLLRKEVYHVLRDRRTLAVITLMPIVQVIIFGYAIRTDVDHVRLAIVDPAPDPATLELRSRFGATDTFRVGATLPAAHDLEPLFRRQRGVGPRGGPDAAGDPRLDTAPEADAESLSAEPERLRLVSVSKGGGV